VVVLAVLAAGAFMAPTLAAPVTGDDRILYPRMGAEESWTPFGAVADLPHWWEVRTSRGRANVLTDIERRSVARAVIEVSVRAGVPTYLVQGALRLLLAALAVLCMAALVRSLRWRRRDGTLARASGPTVLLSTVAGTVLFALGSQPQLLRPNGRNGWVSYPANTYGAVVAIFGVTALVLWLARRYAEGRHRLVTVLGLVLLGALTAFRYELGLVAVPLVVVALVVVPVTQADRAAAGRRARWVVGVAYAGVCLPLLAVLRWYLRGQCQQTACYDGVTPRLSAELPATFWANLVSGVPGVGAHTAERFVESAGAGSTEDMYLPTPVSLLVGAGLLLALVLGWWVTRPGPSAGSDGGVIDDARAETGLLVVGAGLCLLGTLGATAVMSLAESSQSLSSMGVLHRHTVVAWAGMAWALVLALLALARVRSRTGLGAWLALAVAVAAAAAVLLPAHQRALQADRHVNRATSAAFAALAEGERSDAAMAERCRLVPGLLDEPNYPMGGPRAVWAFDAAYRRYWGRSFCDEDLTRLPSWHR